MTLLPLGSLPCTATFSIVGYDGQNISCRLTAKDAGGTTHNGFDTDGKTIAAYAGVQIPL